MEGGGGRPDIHIEMLHVYISASDHVLRVVRMLPGRYHHHRPGIYIYIYIHLPLTSVAHGGAWGEVAAVFLTYWPVGGYPPGSTPGGARCVGVVTPATSGTPARAPGVAMPKQIPRDFFTRKRPSPQKVTKNPAQVAHFVWEKCVARTTPIVKMSPFHKTGTVYCCMNLYHPNGVGEYV
jgi:hypothetical protein